MQNHWRIIASILLAVLFVALFASLGLPPSYEICGPNEYTHAKECAQYHLPQFIFLGAVGVGDTHNGLLTAIFTGVLTIFTIGLWQETRRLSLGAEAQAIQNEKALKAAQKAADAAWLSAQAAIGAETARIVPSQFSIEVISTRQDPLGGLLEPTHQERMARGHIQLEFKNVGRTSAEIIAFFGATAIGDLPSVPNFGAAERLNPPRTAEGHGKPFNQWLFNWDRPPAEDTGSGALSSIFSGRDLWLYGYVEYIDFIGGAYRQKFCARLSRGLLANGKEFWQGGPPQYLGLEKIVLPAASTQEDGARG